ncbi:MAG: MaoC/PaaZ C-terminal domain-containing protein [Gammaproteobacteria bacterium]
MTAVATNATNHRAEAGYRYPAFEVTITAAEQRRLHGWCDIAADVFGDVADPTFVGRPPILLNTATIQASRPGWGPVHLVQRLRQERPIRLDETLRVHGQVTALEPHARGTIMLSRWEYRDAAGATPFVVEPAVLMIDPQASAASRSQMTTTATSAETEWEPLARHVCSPETTLGYCEGSSNLIHLDPDYARGFGLRAPIIAGMQTVNFLVEPLYREAPPAAVEMCIEFLRPVFWDDELTVSGCRDATGRLVEIRALNGAGKAVAALRIAHEEHGRAL